MPKVAEVTGSEKSPPGGDTLREKESGVRGEREFMVNKRLAKRDSNVRSSVIARATAGGGQILGNNMALPSTTERGSTAVRDVLVSQ